MATGSKHPEFEEKSDDYRIMNDTYEGTGTIKEAGFVYLPATSGMLMDGAGKADSRSVGWQAYDIYRTRARFPGHVKSAVSTLSGVMVKEPAVIELPKRMEGMRDDATRTHESLQGLLRRVYENQLQYGRIGLLADFPQFTLSGTPRELPHIVVYDAQSIINWDDERLMEFGLDELNLLVTNETLQVRGTDGAERFEWEQEEQYRVCLLEPVDEEQEVSDGNPLVYKTFVEVEGLQGDTITPLYKGVPMESIPFTFVGESNLDSSPGPIPLLELANLSIGTYQESADYYNTLHQIGGDTLVVIGDELTEDNMVTDSTHATRTGPGSKIHLDEDGDAKFIGIESKGLSEQAKSYQASLDAGREGGARLLEPRKGQAESGEALRTRVASATAQLHQIAITGAMGLEDILRHIAIWIGEDPESVNVIPNTDFIQEMVETREAGDLMDAKQKGLLISDMSVHEWMQRRNLVKTTFDEEADRMKTDKPLPKPEAPAKPAPDVPAAGGAEDTDDE